jgi:hypothetical protein
MVKRFLINITVKRTTHLFILRHLFFIPLVVRSIFGLIEKRINRKLHSKKLKSFERKVGRKSLYDYIVVRKNIFQIFNDFDRIAQIQTNLLYQQVRINTKIIILNPYIKFVRLF